MSPLLSGHHCVKGLAFRNL